MMQRTWLFTPGDDERKLAAAPDAGADALVVDWEDAVAAGREAAARRATGAFFRSAPAGAARKGIRVTAPGSPSFADDVAQAEALGADLLVIPKVEDAAALAGLGAEGPPLVPLVESAAGLERAYAIGTASPRVERLGLGGLDYCADVGALWTPEGEALAYPRARLVVVSRAAGLASPIDTVYPDLEDPEGLRREAARGRVLGFRAKFVVHPSQVAIVRDALTPSEAELAHAERVVAAYRDAGRRGDGVLRVDGRLIDAATLRWSLQVLEDAGG